MATPLPKPEGIAYSLRNRTVYHPKPPTPAMAAATPTLLGLPPELRDQIWTYATAADHASGSPPFPFEPPTVTKVSRQIRFKTSEVFYSTINFKVHVLPKGARYGSFRASCFKDAIEYILRWLEYLWDTDRLKWLRRFEIWNCKGSLDEEEARARVLTRLQMSPRLRRIRLGDGTGLIRIVVTEVPESEHVDGIRQIEIIRMSRARKLREDATQCDWREWTFLGQ